MGKRSRDTSFSPSGDEAASDWTRASTEAEDLPTAKLVAYDSPVMPAGNFLMQCSLPPHAGSLGFTTVEEFEVHYTKEHTNRCAECGKNLPSVHFLNLHLDEAHNPVREALAAKGEKTYACFVPDCEKTCATTQKRRMHLIDKHGFPKVYNFRIVRDGIDNASTLLQEGRRRRVSVTGDQSSSHRYRATSISKPANKSHLNNNPKGSSAAQDESTLLGSALAGSPDDATVRSKDPSSSDSTNVDDLERSFAALHFIPRSVLSRRTRGQS